MIFREIKFASNDFSKECELRNSVLRLPLGLNLFDDDLSNENKQMHFGLFDEAGKLYACVVAVPTLPDEAKIRQMAVDSKHQGAGYGQYLMVSMEAYLAQLGFLHFQMHARVSAVGFYEKRGYTRVGEEFTEIGIPHVEMEKWF